jgi:hypothetical protein
MATDRTLESRRPKEGRRSGERKAERDDPGRRTPMSGVGMFGEVPLFSDTVSLRHPRSERRVNVLWPAYPEVMNVIPL